MLQDVLLPGASSEVEIFTQHFPFSFFFGMVYKTPRYVKLDALHLLSVAAMVGFVVFPSSVSLLSDWLVFDSM